MKVKNVEDSSSPFPPSPAEPPSAPSLMPRRQSDHYKSEISNGPSATPLKAYEFTAPGLRNSAETSSGYLNAKRQFRSSAFTGPLRL